MGGGGWPSPTSRKEEKGVGTLTWLILKIVFLRCLVYLLIQCLIVKWILFFFCSNRSKNNERSTLCLLALCCQAPELLLAAHMLFLYFEYPGTLIPTYYYDYIYIKKNGFREKIQHLRCPMKISCYLPGYTIYTQWCGYTLQLDWKHLCFFGITQLKSCGRFTFKRLESLLNTLCYVTKLLHNRVLNHSATYGESKYWEN